MDLSTTAGIIPRCRHCGHDLTLKLINFGAFARAERLCRAKAEPFYPLEALVCRQCRLVPTRDLLAATDIFWHHRTIRQ